LRRDIAQAILWRARFHLALTDALLCRYSMPAERNRPKRDCFNPNASLPFQLRLEDFEIAMQDVYDLFYDVNTGLLEKGIGASR
jgi:hypothetical protein